MGSSSKDWVSIINLPFDARMSQDVTADNLIVKKTSDKKLKCDRIKACHVLPGDTKRLLC